MKKNGREAAVSVGFIFLLVFFSCAVQAQAGMKEIKAYKEAFPDARVKCATCHRASMPKTGAAELNDYGKASMATSHNAETFKKLGKFEDFKK